jgi:hypothetical protein
VVSARLDRRAQCGESTGPMARPPRLIGRGLRDTPRDANATGRLGF